VTEFRGCFERKAFNRSYVDFRNRTGLVSVAHVKRFSNGSRRSATRRNTTLVFCNEAPSSLYVSMCSLLCTWQDWGYQLAVDFSLAQCSYMWAPTCPTPQIVRINELLQIHNMNMESSFSSSSRCRVGNLRHWLFVSTALRCGRDCVVSSICCLEYGYPYVLNKMACELHETRGCPSDEIVLGSKFFLLVRVRHANRFWRVV
jgi:hypothetical protein